MPFWEFSHCDTGRDITTVARRSTREMEDGKEEKDVGNVKERKQAYDSDNYLCEVPLWLPRCTGLSFSSREKLIGEGAFATGERCISTLAKSLEDAPSIKRRLESWIDTAVNIQSSIAYNSKS